MKASTLCLSFILLTSSCLWAEPAIICPGDPAVPEENYHSLLWDALEQLPNDETVDSSLAEKAIIDALKQGANPNDYSVYDGVYTTPLVVVVQLQKLSLLRLLLEKGANPNRVENRNLATTLISVNRPDMLQLLIEKGWRFNPNLPNGCATHIDGWPTLPLPYAVAIASPKMVETLLKMGADPYLAETSNPEWLKLAGERWNRNKKNAFQACEGLTKGDYVNDLEEKQAAQTQIRKLLEPYSKKDSPETAPAKPLKQESSPDKK